MLAYSTVSQLGFMFVAVGVGAYWVGIFHLMTHAFFKACLFLGSGSVILGCHHEQDMRKMGGLRKLMPITAVTYFLSCCAIAGFPFFSGFFSKDEILWKAFDSGNMLLPGGGLILWVLAATAALCTSFYMFRSYYMTFSGRVPRQRPTMARTAAPRVAAVDDRGARRARRPGRGGRLHRAAASLGRCPTSSSTGWSRSSTARPPSCTRPGRGHGAEWALMGLSVVIAFGGFVLARWLYHDAKSPIPARLLDSPQPLVRGVHRIVYNKYYVDEALPGGLRDAASPVRPACSAWFDARVVDGVVNLCGRDRSASVGELQGWIDRWFVDGLVNLVGDGVDTRPVAGCRHLQTGRIQSYVWGSDRGRRGPHGAGLSVLPW